MSWYQSNYLNYHYQKQVIIDLTPRTHINPNSKHHTTTISCPQIRFILSNLLLPHPIIQSTTPCSAIHEPAYFPQLPVHPQPRSKPPLKIHFMPSVHVPWPAGLRSKQPIERGGQPAAAGSHVNAHLRGFAPARTLLKTCRWVGSSG